MCLFVLATVSPLFYTPSLILGFYSLLHVVSAVHWASFPVAVPFLLGLPLNVPLSASICRLSLLFQCQPQGHGAVIVSSCCHFSFHQHLSVFSPLSFFSPDLSNHAGGCVNLTYEDDPSYFVSFYHLPASLRHTGRALELETPQCAVEKWEWLKPGPSYSSDSLESAKKDQWTPASKTGEIGEMIPRKERRMMEGYSWGR